jgi:PKD repeat protein
MAYRFTGSSTSLVEFALGPFSGYTFGAFTAAVLLKRNGTGYMAPIFLSNAAGGSAKVELRIDSPANSQHWYPGGCGGTEAMNTTTTWYLLAVTGTGSGSPPRWHLYDGVSWAHQASPNNSGSAAIVVGDRLFGSPPVAWGGEYVDADVVCIGMKKANTSDAGVQALSYTDFTTWTAFGFDWLIGYETSSALVNRASPGSGNEISRSGVSVVSDPPGWIWAPAVAPVADFTGTPTSGNASLSVAFTDASTNSPTSWAWNFGDGGTSTAQNPTHSYTASGVYTVQLTATNGAGSNTKTRTAYITVTETIAYASGGGIDIY